MMADEATQGIDPDGAKKNLEENHLIPLWQGVNREGISRSSPQLRLPRWSQCPVSQASPFLTESVWPLSVTTSKGLVASPATRGRPSQLHHTEKVREKKLNGGAKQPIDQIHLTQAT